jgi:leucyl/phenylalanyl-tRNA--protein transferase
MSMLPWLRPEDPFPSCEGALDDPNGLLAAGADLSSQRLLQAYKQGIFPWFNEGQPILWWSPNPRCVLIPDEAHRSRSLRKFIRKSSLSLSFNQHFQEVITHCARAEQENDGWITDDMIDAYRYLHQLGHAHSLEVRQDGELAGGLYGLAIGKVFFGESMFSLRPNTSKVAFAALSEQLMRWGFKLIDCQVENDHLMSLGARKIDRHDFLAMLTKYTEDTSSLVSWQFDEDILNVISQP